MELLHLLHAGPTHIISMLSRRSHIVGGQKIIPSIIHACVTCHHVSAKPKPQMLSQLPTDWLEPGSIFHWVEVDYAGPVLLKSGSICKPVLTKPYICVFCLMVKAVYFELVSDLTSEGLHWSSLTLHFSSWETFPNSK